VEIFAHRGVHTGAGAPRENTVAAFALAVALGADGVELDVRATRDGSLVVHHDPAVPGSRAPIAELPRSALPSEVPSLAEALAACDGLLVNVEVKHSSLEPGYDEAERLARQVAGELAARGEAERFVVSSFSLASVDAVRAEAPFLPTAWLVGAGADALGACAVAAAHGHDGLHPEESLVDAALVDVAHAAGLRVRAWTVDDPERAAELVGAGVDALITNEVAALRSRLGGLCPPSA
jgi:glycerophosphoryl diester phosphodiesterase